MVCWFPYACTSIAETAGYMPQGQVRGRPSSPVLNTASLRHYTTCSVYILLQASYFLFAVSTLMTKTSVCTDPIIYFWLNTQVCKIYWLVASYTMPISILNLFSQFQFRKELLSLTGRLEREPSQSMTGISLTSFYTRPIIRSAGQSEDRNNTSQKV